MRQDIIAAVGTRLYIWRKFIPADRGACLTEIPAHPCFPLQTHLAFIWKKIIPADRDPAWLLPGSRPGGTFFSHINTNLFIPVHRGNLTHADWIKLLFFHVGSQILLVENKFEIIRMFLAYLGELTWFLFSLRNKSTCQANVFLSSFKTKQIIHPG